MQIYVARVQLQRGLRFLLKDLHFIERFPKSCKPPSEYDVSLAFFHRPVWGSSGGAGDVVLVYRITAF